MINGFLSKKVQSQSNELLNNTDVVIHIGAPKAGSSAIQSFCMNNRNKLEEIGFYYPEHCIDSNSVSGGHSQIGVHISRNNLGEAQKIYNSYLLIAREKKLVLLLSAESFYFHSDRVSSIVANERVKIVVFYRDPMESLFSNYNQGVKRHYQTRTIEDVCKLLVEKKSLDLRPEEVISKWKKNFTEKSIVEIEYNKEYFEKIAIQEVFLNSIGVNSKAIRIIKPKQIQIINKSYTLAELEFKRLVNIVANQSDKKSNALLDQYLQACSDEKDESVNLLDNISLDLILKLEEKFKRGDLSSRKSKVSIGRKISDMLAIVQNLELYNRELYSYIKSSIEKYIANEQSISQDVHNLSTYFGLRVKEEVKRDVWFSQSQLNKMASGKYQEPDFLRDLAGLLTERGDFDNAEKIISKSLELRPNGVVIKKMNKKIKTQLNSAGRN